MRRSLHIAAAVWLVAAFGVAGAAPSTGDPSALFAEASDAFAAGDYALAADYFEAAKAAGMTGPAVDYNRGVSYYRLGAYAEAAQVFEDLSAHYPEMQAIAEYNLGLALTSLGKVADARRAFERARAAEDQAIVALAEAMLERTGAPRGSESMDESRWLGLFDLAVGYDDNVALVDEASLPAGLSSSSPMVEAFGYFSGRVGAARAVRIDASAYSVRYARAKEFDQDGVQIGIAYLWQAGSWQFDAGSHYARSLLAGDWFERRLGASVTARYPLGESASMSFRYVHDDVGDLSSEYRFVKGSRNRLSVAFQQRGERGRLALGFARERNDRLSPTVSPQRHELFAGYEHSLSADWSVGVEGRFRASRYGRLAVPRDEELSQLSLTATRDFRSGWQLLGQYRVAENSSNEEAFVYDRNRLLLSMNRLF